MRVGSQELCQNRRAIHGAGGDAHDPTHVQKSEK